MVLKYYTGDFLGRVHLRGFFLHPMRGGHCTKNGKMAEREGGTEIMMRLSEQSLELIRVFTEASKIFV